ARIHQPPPAAASGGHGDLGAVGIASSERWINGAQCQPVTAGRRTVSKELRGPPGAGDDQVHGAIVVEGATRQAPADRRPSTEGRIGPGTIAEGSVTLICEKLVSLRIRGPEGRHARRNCLGAAATLDLSVHERQVQRAVVIEVHEDRAKPGAMPTLTGETAQSHSILKKAARFLHPKSMMFLGQVADEQ